MGILCSTCNKERLFPISVIITLNLLLIALYPLISFLKYTIIFSLLILAFLILKFIIKSVSKLYKIILEPTFPFSP